MVQSGQITLYTEFNSPFCQRVHIALDEAKAEYTTHVIDLKNKPSWYIEKVNPAAKIPAMTYGGPKTPPDGPSPDSAKFNESLIINEFIAETFPEAHLLPADPIKRAHARMFISVFETKGLPAFAGMLFGSSSCAKYLDVLEELQRMLPEAGFAVGEWSLADIAVGPFLVRTKCIWANEIGKYPLGDGRKSLDEIDGPRFRRLEQYMEDIEQKPTFQATWDEASFVGVYGKIPYVQRD